MNYKIKTFLMMAISFSLISCKTLSPREYQSQLHKLSRFNQSYYVYEKANWRPGGGGIYLLPVNWTSKPFLYEFPASVQDYLKNKRAWSAWHSTDLIGGDKYKILGLVDKNTTYRLDKVVIGYASAHQKITIVTGQFAGTSIIVEGTGWGRRSEMYGETVKLY